MKRKGFTLVELLAIVVIISVIAVITTPIVFNVIQKSKVKALESSAMNIIKAAQQKKGKDNIDGKLNHLNLMLPSTELNYKGKDYEGQIEINEDGESAIKIIDGKNCAYKSFKDDKITITTDLEKCSSVMNLSIEGSVNYYFLTPSENPSESGTIEAKKSNRDIILEGSVYVDLTKQDPTDESANPSFSLRQKIDKSVNQRELVYSFYHDGGNLSLKSNYYNLFSGYWDLIATKKIIKKTNFNTNTFNVKNDFSINGTVLKENLYSNFNEVSKNQVILGYFKNNDFFYTTDNIIIHPNKTSKCEILNLNIRSGGSMAGYFKYGEHHSDMQGFMPYGLSAGNNFDLIILVAPKGQTNEYCMNKYIESKK